MRRKKPLARFAIAFALAPACTETPVSSPEPAVHRSVTIFHVADIHSHLFPRQVVIGPRDAALGLGAQGQTVRVGGAARLAALLSRERARRESSFFFDAGDVLEGTSVFSLFHGVPEMLTLESLGLDAAALGNHDLSRGEAALSAVRTGRASFPLLAANLDRELGSGLALASTVVERGGVRVLAIGLGRTPTDAVDLDVSAAVVEAGIRAAGASADVIVVLSHLGRDLDLELVPKTSGIDLVLGGHTHDVLEPPAIVMDCGADARARTDCESHAVLVAHPGAYGRYLGRFDLVVSTDPRDRSLRGARTRSVVVDSRFALLPVNDVLPERPDVAALLAPYADALRRAGFEEPFAVAPSGVSRQKPLRADSPLGNFVAHSMRAAAGADLAVINSTGIRADLPKGTLTPDDFYEILPFDDALVTVDISGAELVRSFSEVARESCGRDRVSQVEIDGGTLELSCDPRATGTVSIEGKSIETGSVYRLATASFLAEERQWFFGRGKVVSTGAAVRDVVMAATRAAKPCDGEDSGAFPCLNETAGALADGRIVWK